MEDRLALAEGKKQICKYDLRIHHNLAPKNHFDSVSSLPR